MAKEAIMSNEEKIEQKSKKKQKISPVGIAFIFAISIITILLLVWVGLSIAPWVKENWIELLIIVVTILSIAFGYIIYEWDKLRKTTDSYIIKKIESMPKGFAKWFEKYIHVVRQDLGSMSDSTMETFVKVNNQMITEHDKVLVENYRKIYKGLNSKIKDIYIFVELLPGKTEDIPEIKSYTMQINKLREELDIYFYEINIEELTSISELIFIQKTMQKILELSAEMFEIILTVEPKNIIEYELDLREQLINRGNVKKHIESCIRIINK